MLFRLIRLKNSKTKYLNHIGYILLKTKYLNNVNNIIFNIYYFDGGIEPK